MGVEVGVEVGVGSGNSSLVLRDSLNFRGQRIHSHTGGLINTLIPFQSKCPCSSAGAASVLELRITMSAQDYNVCPPKKNQFSTSPFWLSHTVVQFQSANQT